MADTYTKFVLTIIATALVVLAVNNLTHTATAQTGVTRVQVCDEQNCVGLFPIRQTVQGRTVITWGLPVLATH
jgi:hypothetical protein